MKVIGSTRRNHLPLPVEESYGWKIEWKRLIAAVAVFL